VRERAPPQLDGHADARPGHPQHPGDGGPAQAQRRSPGRRGCGEDGHEQRGRDRTAAEIPLLTRCQRAGELRRRIVLSHGVPFVITACLPGRKRGRMVVRSR